MVMMGLAWHSLAILSLISLPSTTTLPLSPPLSPLREDQCELSPELLFFAQQRAESWPVPVVLMEVAESLGKHHTHSSHPLYVPSHPQPRRPHSPGAGPLSIDNVGVELGDGDATLRHNLVHGHGTHPLAPARPARPFFDLLKKLMEAIVTMVWGLLQPIIIPLITLLFTFCGPLIVSAVAFPLLSTAGPVMLNLFERFPGLNRLIQLMLLPIFLYFTGMPKAPAFGLPYMSFHGPPYGNLYGQAVHENLKCYSILEEYLKRCTQPANTLPLSFLQLSSSAQTHPVTPTDLGDQPRLSTNADKELVFLELSQEPESMSLRDNIYEGAAAGGLHPPVQVGFTGPDLYDPYGPDGPESDPSPNVGFRRCHELLDTWLNTCGSPTS